MNTLTSVFPLLLLSGVAVGLLAWGLTHVVRLVENAFEVDPTSHLTADDMKRVNDELTGT